MAYKIDFAVAEVSPNIYAAAEQANLSKTQITQIEQFSRTVKKNKKLIGMPLEKARNQFNELDTQVQDMLRFLYPDADYAKPAADAGDKLLGLVKGAAKVAASPLIGVFKAAGAYSKAINLPYLVGRQTAQGENFGLDVLSDAWDGRKVFDEGALAQAVQDFGAENVEIAKGLLMGKKPGEIVESQGQLTQPFLDAFSKAFNDDAGFKQVMDAVKYAQVSPGRDIARMLNKPSTKTPNYISSQTKNVSGFVDFMYQVLIDPLTYLTFGASKVAPYLARKGWADINIGDRMVASIEEHGTGGVAKVFDSSPLLRKHWNDEIGPEIKRLSGAKGTEEKSKIIREIKSRFPGHANDKWIRLLENNKIYNANDAVKYFGDDIDATLDLIAGKVEGVQFFRTGIATARNQRILDLGFGKFIDKQLNPAMDLPEVKTKGESVWDTLTKFGTERNNYVSPQVAEIQKFTQNLSRRERIGRAFAKSPQGRAIKIGENAIDTADNFRDTARQVLPRDLADFLTIKFVNADAADQVSVLRSLYYAIMQKYGVDGTAKGREIIEKELQSHFGSAKGAGMVENIQVPDHLKGVIGGTGVRVLPEGIFYESNGIIHPFQEANAIGSLDYMLLAQLGYEAKNKTNLIKTVTKGAGQSKFSTNLVNSWTILTLFPRLGVRSAIDEGVMYLLTAPARDIMNTLLPKAVAAGRAAGKIATAISGSRSAEGFAATFRRKMGAPVTAETVPVAQRYKIRQDLAYQNVIPEEMVSNADILTDVGSYVSRILPDKITPEQLDWTIQANVHGAGVVTGMTNSIVAKASAGGRYGAEIAEDILLPNNWEKALKDADLATGAKGRLVDTKDLERSEAFGGRAIAGTHYQKFTQYFYGNDKIVIGEKVIRDPSGKMVPIKTSYKFKPVDVFFENNALKTDDDYIKARDTLLEALGVVRTQNVATSKGLSPTVTHKVEDPKAFANGIGALSRTTDLRQRGLAEVEMATDIVDRILLDTYTAFHGSATKFNDGLYNRIKKSYNRYVAEETGAQKAVKEAALIIRSKTATPAEKAAAKAAADAATIGRRPIKNKWNVAAQSIEFDDFVNLTKGYQPSGKIFTNIDFIDVEGIVDQESAWAKLGGNMMDIMDRQVTGILRQPALWATYFRIRENYKKLESQDFNRLMEQQYKILAAKLSKDRGIDWANLSQKDKDRILKEVVYREKRLDLPRGSGAREVEVTRLSAMESDVREMVQKKYTEVALQQAADTILKYVDNPNIRTNFAISVRNVGRFYRATEDFWRRVYRMKDVSPRALYRMRLTHTGIDAYGGLYEDANGDPYLMMPMDDVIFKTVESVTRVFSGTTGFKQPLFNDFTLKLKLANPSFDDQSGVPTFSGPIAALSVLGMKTLLGSLGFKKTAEDLDNFALGSIGENMTLTKAVVPAPLQRIYALLPKSEKDRQEATAAMQAIAFNAARGNIPNANASAEEKYEYLRNVRISAHNILVMRSVLGLLAPVAPTIQESKEVPDYLKAVGITSVRAEFYDYVNAITKKYGADIQNPYDMAVASFVGNNPDKLVYTVARDDKQTNTLIAKTKEMKNWYIDNKSLVDKYGEAAFIFAPKVGEFDASSYAWLEAADFIKNKDLDKYYLDVMTSQDKRAYFEIARREREALANTGSPTARRAIINNSTIERQAMKAANPFLDAIITGGGFEIASETVMFENLEQMVQDPAFKIPEATRSKMMVAISQMRNFIQLAQDPALRGNSNFADVKRQRKADIEALLAQMLEGDLIIKEANRAVFQTLLDYYSRETYRV